MCPVCLLRQSLGVAEGAGRMGRGWGEVGWGRGGRGRLVGGGWRQTPPAGRPVSDPALTLARQPGLKEKRY